MTTLALTLVASVGWTCVSLLVIGCVALLTVTIRKP